MERLFLMFSLLSLFVWKGGSHGLTKIGTKHSSGPDGFPSVLLRALAPDICDPLAFIFNSSMLDNNLPKAWLHANVTPIHKKGPTCDPNNYRPISLTCVCCRVMETIINRHIIDHLQRNNLINKHQHGFLKRHSTCTNLLESVNDWTIALNNRQTTDVIYIDFQKAFDSVSHPKLLVKIKTNAIDGNVLAWITAFLSNRTQSVRLANSKSATTEVTSGVPQGSVLGPTLFLIFINDITSILQDLDVQLKLFADDIKLYSSYTNDSSENLATVCQRLTGWAKTWQLPVAVNKCFALRISNSRPSEKSPQPRYTLFNTPLPWVTEARDLGITIDTRLNFNQHISLTTQKAHTRANLILRSFISRSPQILMQAFVTYVRPLLEYCIPVYNPHTSKNIIKLESVQRNFTKRLRGFHNIPYQQRLVMLDTESLELRRLKIDLTECYKILNKMYETDLHRFFSSPPYPATRGHCLKLHKSSSRIDPRKFFFSNRVIDTWNNLSDEIVKAQTISSFRKKLENHCFAKFVTLCNCSSCSHPSSKIATKSAWKCMPTST